MTWFGHLKISSKLLAGFIVVLGLAGGLGGFAITRLSVIRDRVDVLTHESLPGITAAAGLAEMAGDVRRQLLVHLAATEPDEKLEAARTIESDVASLTNQLAGYRATGKRAELQALVAQFQAQWSEYLRAQAQLMQPSAEPGNAARYASRAIFEAARDTLTQIVKRTTTDGDAATASIYGVIGSVRLWVTIILVVLCVAGALVAVRITRMFIQPMRELDAAARAMANGEPGAEVRYAG